ncbi:hypothetical protein ACVK1X_000798 [Pseudomonas sp. PvR086]|nr:hypothetical protein [Pseudomonas frederiksbergensis]PZW60174.1 hypothetical protein F475_03119 [Pseudomonas sp. URMO17WK12:I6]CAH0289243.1 hypothetical protein SRABI130_04300 [Pseudomonas sp. Bi130]
MDYPNSVPSASLVDVKFVDGNPITGTPGSLIPASCGNGVTLELLKVIEAAGIKPSEASNDQLLTALRSNKLFVTAPQFETSTLRPSPASMATSVTRSIPVEALNNGASAPRMPMAMSTSPSRSRFRRLFLRSWPPMWAAMVRWSSWSGDRYQTGLPAESPEFFRSGTGGIGRKGRSFLSASNDPVRHFGWLDIFDTNQTRVRA